MNHIVILGGTNQDIFAYSHQQIKLNDSNPGYLKESFGGVGRNIAENLARLKLNPTLITAIGNDEIGKNIISEGSKIGISFDSIWIEKTPKYLAVINQNKDMLVAIAAMDDVEKMTVNQITDKLDALKAADLLIIDTNYSKEVLTYVFDQVKAPIFVEAISTIKAEKLKPFYSKIQLLKLNLVEAQSLSNINGETKFDIEKIGIYFYHQKVKEILITLGNQGAYYFDGKNHQFVKGKNIEIENTTGAGDAFFAGAIYAKIHDMNILSCGIASSIITLKDEKAVSPYMNPQYLLKTIKEYQL